MAPGGKSRNRHVPDRREPSLPRRTDPQCIDPLVDSGAELLFRARRTTSEQREYVDWLVQDFFGHQSETEPLGFSVVKRTLFSEPPPLGGNDECDAVTRDELHMHDRPGVVPCSCSSR